MSKMKRKWLRVIDFEENGTPIDDSTRQQLMETHPDLPVLHQSSHVVPEAEMMQAMLGAEMEREGELHGGDLGVGGGDEELEQQLQEQIANHQHHHGLGAHGDGEGIVQGL